MKYVVVERRFQNDVVVSECNFEYEAKKMVAALNRCGDFSYYYKRIGKVLLEETRFTDENS